jgi:hypothetical protein
VLCASKKNFLLFVASRNPKRGLGGFPPFSKEAEISSLVLRKGDRAALLKQRPLMKEGVLSYLKQKQPLESVMSNEGELPAFRYM